MLLRLLLARRRLFGAVALRFLRGASTASDGLVASRLGPRPCRHVEARGGRSRSPGRIAGQTAAQALSCTPRARQGIRPAPGHRAIPLGSREIEGVRLQRQFSLDFRRILQRTTAVSCPITAALSRVLLRRVISALPTVMVCFTRPTSTRDAKRNGSDTQQEDGPSSKASICQVAHGHAADDLRHAVDGAEAAVQHGGDPQVFEVIRQQRHHQRNANTVQADGKHPAPTSALESAHGAKKIRRQRVQRRKRLSLSLSCDQTLYDLYNQEDLSTVSIDFGALNARLFSETREPQVDAVD
eukprot:scaffold330_cov246-Pinguiococcus_pyrenoidosus.AAC.25